MACGMVEQALAQAGARPRACRAAPESTSCRHRRSTSGSASASKASNAALPPARTTSSGSWPAGSATKRRVRSGPRWGRARIAARMAAFCPAQSPSKQQDRRRVEPPQAFQLGFGQRRAERARRLRRCRPGRGAMTSIYPSTTMMRFAVRLAGLAQVEVEQACGPCRTTACRASSDISARRRQGCGRRRR